LIDAGGTGPGGLPAHVDDARPLGDQRPSVGDRGDGVLVPAAVGEGVGRDAQDPHHAGAVTGEPRRQSVGPGAGHLDQLRLMRLIDSARVLGLSRSMPRTALVSVRAPSARTPLMDMHLCSASITTIAPEALISSIRASAICEVMRACTCGRRASTWTSRASLLSPVTFPAPGMYRTWAIPKDGSRCCSPMG